jgi:hypothetical protein
VKPRNVFFFHLYFKQWRLSQKSFDDSVEITDEVILSLKFQVQMSTKHDTCGNQEGPANYFSILENIYFVSGLVKPKQDCHFEYQV